MLPLPRYVGHSFPVVVPCTFPFPLTALSSSRGFVSFLNHSASAKTNRGPKVVLLFITTLGIPMPGNPFRIVSVSSNESFPCFVGDRAEGIIATSEIHLAVNAR